MDLTLTLHAMAGLGALALGGGTLLREPSRGRNRQFALLCAALGLWNLGLVGHSTAGPGNELVWRLVYLLGSCASAPLGLRFVLGLAGVPDDTRRRWFRVALVPAALLWAASVTPLRDSPWGWSLAAIGVIGGTLAVALAVLGRHAFRLPAGPERRALLLVFWGGVVAVLGGVSDLLPRDGFELMRLGPPAVLVLLIFMCAVIVRHRFLDVHVFLIRVVALLAGAAVIGLVLLGATRVFGGGYLVLFLTSVLILAAAGPVGRLILTRTRSLLRPEDPVSAALVQISRDLPRATRREEVWSAIESGRRSLAEDVRLDVYFRAAGTDDFRPLVGSQPGSRRDSVDVPVLDAGDPLARWLERERRAVSRSYLERERNESPRKDGLRAGEALRRFDELELRVAVPLISGERLAGWVGLGRGLGQRYITAEVAAAMQAVGQQALASLERIEALEAARRKESLAAVGELAAGLAHEVRNPVAAIRGAAQALGPGATEAQREEMLEVIAEETERLGRFAGEFLEYGRPASPRREPVDLERVARGSIRGLEAAGLRLAVELDCGADVPALPADPEQIHRVFDNLIRNAGEAAGEGGKLRIEIRRAGQERVSIRFEDNGPGIPAEETRLLFQPFHSTKPGGTGLGLALVHRIVEAHGGEIRVEGRPGAGASFMVLLPERAAGADDDGPNKR